MPAESLWTVERDGELIETGVFNRAEQEYRRDLYAAGQTGAAYELVEYVRKDVADAREKALIEALAFYADPDHYDVPSSDGTGAEDDTAIGDDGGQRARAALVEPKERD